jgi:thioredoxin-like negative regulator of GroEL
MTWATAQKTGEIYAKAPHVRPLTDANYWNVFYDRNKIIVVDFWTESCRPCDRVAQVMVQLAARYYRGPGGLVKFYHVQLDEDVNPVLTRQLGFRSFPIVYFYYTATGHPPTHEQPLLEGSAGAPDEVKLEDCVQKIEAIKQRHGHR